MPDRAQSELVGAILVLGLVVVSVGVAGSYAMGTVTQSSEAPDATITGQIGTDELVLSHQGGEALPSDELRLVARVNGSGTGLAWSDGTLSGGDGDDVFDPGETWTAAESYDPDSVVTLRLVHEPSNTVLFRTETTPTVTTPIESDVGGYVEAVDSEGVAGGATPGDGDDGDDEEVGGPIEAAVYDLTYIDGNSPHYIVSYDAAPVNDSFDRVEVAFEGDNARSGTITADGPRGSVEFDGDYAANREYTITIRTYYDDGEGGTTVGRARTITDRSDTVDPTGDDLSEPGSPTLTDDTTIVDESIPNENKVKYRFDYEVETNGNYDGVVFAMVNRNGNGDAIIKPGDWRYGDVQTESASSGDPTLKTDYGTNTEHKLVLLVLDDDGVVVDSLIVFDRADGDERDECAFDDDGNEDDCDDENDENGNGYGNGNGNGYGPK